MAKRLSEKEKEQILISFTNGKSINDLSSDFKCTKLTITRNLKRNLGEKKYKELIEMNLSSAKKSKEGNAKVFLNNKNESYKKNDEDNFELEYFSDETFMEITPLNCDIENSKQKDLTSVPVSEFVFPKVVYMIVSKKIELETKYLKDYPDWQFLSEDELNKKTIEIYLDLKNAKRICNKEQKVIKVPNTEVFKIVAPILLSKGISRIISADKLIAL